MTPDPGELLPMCGIAGEVSFRGQPPDAGWAKRACALMAHRGPDGEGVYASDGVALAHRRLSVIDLEGGAQPMSYAGGRYWITYNGEIYNYRELRAELEQAGLRFETRSDTEVILAAYAHWGPQCLEQLNGIFAFGLWDAEARTLLLARDPLGVKPLLYQRDSQGLLFASELKALLAHPRVRREIDPAALQQYLALGYVLAPSTILRGVCKLPPGESLLATPEKAETRSYWDLASFAGPAEPALPEEAWLERFDALLERSVARQLVADVPLGAFLSGGIDSSTISYYAGRHATGRLRTFSIGFEQESYSELAHARRAAAHLGTDHVDRLAAPDSLDELADLAWYYDEPLGDTSTVPTYYLARLAREGVTVALSGDGGDELLAGYDTYLADRLQRLYARVPRWIHERLLLPAVRRIPSSYRKVPLDFKLKQFVSNAYQSAERAHFGWRSMFDAREREALTGTAGDPFSSYARHYDAVPDASPLKRSLYVDLKTWLADDILTKVDRASMACGLEVRVPLLDPDLVRCAMGLPDHLKLRGLRRKYILKKLMRGRLPRATLERAKRGFNAPVSDWMRHRLRDDIADLFRNGASSSVDLSGPLLSRLWNEHCRGASDHGHQLWTVLSLALWEQRVLR